MIRTFVAVDLPPEIKTSLAASLAALKARNKDVRWVSPEAMHLTLKFLGDIPEALVAPLGADLDAVAAAIPAIELCLAGLGAFPSLHRPRVVWVGIGGETDRLAKLALKVDEACSRHGVAREERPFTGHITLGRLKRPSVLDLRVEPVQGVFTATEIVLYKSDLSPSGARYTVLHTSRLKPRGG